MSFSLDTFTMHCDVDTHAGSAPVTCIVIPHSPNMGDVSAVCLECIKEVCDVIIIERDHYQRILDLMKGEMDGD